MNYFEITIRIFATVFLYLLWRTFLKTKDDVQKHLNDMNENWYNQLASVSQELTRNLNEMQRITNDKIRFLHFQNNYRFLPKTQYFELLAENGFSQEVLKEIGVQDEVFIEAKGEILPQSVLDKYNDFINELNKHNEASQGEASE